MELVANENTKNRDCSLILRGWTVVFRWRSYKEEGERELAMTM